MKASHIARLRSDAAYLIVGIPLSLIAAIQAATSGIGLEALTQAPLMNARDAVSHAALLQQTIEGNPFLGARLGYPFGTNWLDWPSLDWGLLAIAKVLSFFTHDYVLIFNAIFLLGFPTAFLAAFVVARRFDLSRPFAFTVGLSYALASYHFERLSLHGHLFLTWYWVAPVFILLGWRIVAPADVDTQRPSWLRWMGLAALTGFGVYYTAFGLITITTALFLALALRQPRDAIRSYLFVVVPLLLGVALQVLPTLLNRLQFGANPLAFERSTLGAEIYALRPVQLLLPHLTHRIPILGDIANQFYSAAISGNESVMSSVGAIAALGLWVLLQLVITIVARGQLDDRLRYLFTIAMSFMAFASIGGLGLLLSLLGFTEIRSWNRLSIFLAFVGLLTTCIALTPTAMRYSQAVRRALTPVALIVVLGLVWVDQTPAPCLSCVLTTQSQRAVSADFVHVLEKRLPTGAAIYQLPYVSYPEGWRLPNYDAYEFMKPYLESSSLRFNLGGMKGRDGDRLYRSLAQRSLATQVSVIRKLGFAGIYVDRTGIADGGTAVVASLIALLGPDAATWRIDNRIVYFDLHNGVAPIATGALTYAQVNDLTGFTPAFPKRHLSD